VMRMSFSANSCWVGQSRHFITPSMFKICSCNFNTHKWITTKY
jgi:hypothetical protein